MNKLRDQANVGFNIGKETIVPNEDFLWDDFKALHEYSKAIAKRCNELQEIVEKQDIEIDKLKRHVANRVQKIEIVKFLGEESIPKPKQTIRDVEWSTPKKDFDDD